MEQIITLKVDLERPDDAKFAIDEAVKAYEADRLKWTEEEIAEAKHLAMKIMEQLCLDGYSIEWCRVTEAYDYKAVSVWLKARAMKALSEMQRAASFLLLLILGFPSAYACAGLPAGMCPLLSSKRLVSAGDEIS